jgi:hypothetical protein
MNEPQEQQQRAGRVAPIMTRLSSVASVCMYVCMFGLTISGTPHF